MADKKQPGATDLLKEDHDKVKDLFEQFEKAKDQATKDEIADKVDLELRVHSMIEEEILYPVLPKSDSDMVAEAFEEHGVVEELLNELATMDLEDEQFDAKFKVMSENVLHHIEEEESEMFPKVKQELDNQEIGMRMAQRKVELMKQLESVGDAADRVESATPATMEASAKSESTLAAAPDRAPAAKAPSRRSASSNNRSRRATASSGRSRK